MAPAIFSARLTKSPSTEAICVSASIAIGCDWGVPAGLKNHDSAHSVVKIVDWTPWRFILDTRILTNWAGACSGSKQPTTCPTRSTGSLT